MRGYLIYESVDAASNATFIQMLQEEAKKQHIELTVVLAEHYAEQSTTIDFVWNRSRNATIAQHFEQQRIPVFNNCTTNEMANNKQLASEFVRTLNIQTVPTYTNGSTITHFPVVFKTVDGHGGQEVLLCHSLKQLQAASASFEERSTMIQPFIESNAQDVRVWMLGQEVLGAVLRTGSRDFKSNYTLGGSIATFNLPPSLKEAVVKIAAALKSDYIGIDFIKGVDGQFYFNEIEDPVGARSYYDLYGNDLTQKLITYIKKQL